MKSFMKLQRGICMPISNPKMTETDIRTRIRSDLAGNGPSTTDEIARRLVADYWEVQMAVCRMFVRHELAEAGMKDIDGRLRRPVWSLAAPTGEQNG
jgi:hypothetical protein